MKQLTKPITFLLGLLVANVVGFHLLIASNAFTHSLGVNPGDEFVWTVNIADKEEWLDTFNSSLESEFGANATTLRAQKKIRITSMGANEKAGYWRILDIFVASMIG